MVESGLKDVLVPESYLAGKDAQIRELTVPLAEKYWLNFGETCGGPEFRRHILFTEPVLLAAVGLADLDDAKRYYNAYYWFLMGLMADSRVRGYHMLWLQQKAWDVMTSRDFDHVDVSIVEAIRDAAGYEEM